MAASVLCKPSFLLLFSSFPCLLFLLTEAHKRGAGITLDLIHRDSVRAPSYDPSLDKFQRFRSSIDRSFSRKSSFSRKPDSFGTTVNANGGEYLMRINLGSPPVEILAIADTGSDLTWTQCTPCEQCYDQRGPIFNPRKSGSYKTVPCSSPLCDATATGSCGTRNECNYQVNYGDQSYSMGDLATETLTFNSNSGGKSVSFSGFSFGCGHQNQGTFSANGSGIVGLGGGDISLVKQLGDSIDGKFSYCLTSIDSSVPSRISFGREAEVKGRNVVSTPLAKTYPDTFYFLTLEGISVGTRRLPHRKSLRQSVGSQEGNIIIDSGTTMTYLPQDLYTELESSLVRTIKERRTNDSQGNFGLCYEKPAGRSFMAPPITAHFTGADLLLKEGTFMEVEEGVICLMFVPSGDAAIFGNLHQMNYLIGYDLVSGVVNFQPTDCARSR